MWLSVILSIHSPVMSGDQVDAIVSELKRFVEEPIDEFNKTESAVVAFSKLFIDQATYESVCMKLYNLHLTRQLSQEQLNMYLEISLHAHNVNKHLQSFRDTTKLANPVKLETAGRAASLTTTAIVTTNSTDNYQPLPVLLPTLIPEIKQEGPQKQTSERCAFNDLSKQEQASIRHVATFCKQNGYIRDDTRLKSVLLRDMIYKSVSPVHDHCFETWRYITSNSKTVGHLSTLLLQHTDNDFNLIV